MSRSKLRSIAMSGYYTDGIDHSNLDPNISDPDLNHSVDSCVNCGEEFNVTITDEKDICHECGNVEE